MRNTNDKYDIFDKPHSDASGDAKWYVICQVLAGKDSGETGMWMTPFEYKEYCRGMTMLAEMG
jgi:hypothetical protein